MYPFGKQDLLFREFHVKHPVQVLASVTGCPHLCYHLVCILFFVDLQVSIGDRAVVQEDCIPHPQVKAPLDAR